MRAGGGRREGDRSCVLVYAAVGPPSSGSVTNALRQLVRCMKPRDPAFHENVLAGREDFRSVERSRIHTDLLGRFCAGEHQVAAARCAKTPCSMHGGGILGSISSDPGEAGRGKGSPCDYRRTGITLTHPAMAITGVQGRRCHAKSDFSAQTTPVMGGHDDLRLDDGFFVPTGILPHHLTAESKGSKCSLGLRHWSEAIQPNEVLRFGTHDE